MLVIILLMIVSHAHGGLVKREAPAPAHRVEQCLLQFLFYHEDSASCWDALDFGPCPEGEWLVPGQEAGVVHCVELDQALSRCRDFEVTGPGKVGCLEERPKTQVDVAKYLYKRLAFTV